MNATIHTSVTNLKKLKVQVKSWRAAISYTPVWDDQLMKFRPPLDKITLASRVRKLLLEGKISDARKLTSLWKINQPATEVFDFVRRVRLEIQIVTVRIQRVGEGNKSCDIIIKYPFYNEKLEDRIKILATENAIMKFARRIVFISQPPGVSSKPEPAFKAISKRASASSQLVQRPANSEQVSIPRRVTKSLKIIKRPIRNVWFGFDQTPIQSDVSI